MLSACAVCDSDSGVGDVRYPLTRGDRVTLLGLASSPNITGQSGTVLDYDAAKEPWQIELDETKSTKLAKVRTLSRWVEQVAREWSQVAPPLRTDDVGTPVSLQSLATFWRKTLSRFSLLHMRPDVSIIRVAGKTWFNVCRTAVMFRWLRTAIHGSRATQLDLQLILRRVG